MSVLLSSHFPYICAYCCRTNQGKCDQIDGHGGITGNRMGVLEMVEDWQAAELS